MLEPEVIERETIRELLVRYVSLVDQGRYQEVAPLFAPDAILEVTDEEPSQGAIEIEALLVRAGDSLRHHMASPILRHHLSSIVIDFVEPHQARTTGYFIAVTEIGPDHWGRYRDTLIRTDDAWRIQRRLIQIEGFANGGWQDRRRRAALVG